jgi:transmembrane sensor
VAAAVAIFFLSTLLLFRPGGEAPAEARIVSTRLGEIRTVTLEDDSRVTLDTDSRIAIGYGRVERRVELQAGRARFFVRKAPRRPFIVQADGGQVVVLGTTFDVSVVGAGATVSLLEGAAEVIVARTAGEARIKLRPGQRVSIGSAGLDPAVPLPEAETKWPTGMLEFRSTPLRRVIAEANRYSSRKIRLVARGTGDLRVTGTFRAGDTAGLARSLATAFGLRVENGGRGGIVLHPPG